MNCVVLSRRTGNLTEALLIIEKINVLFLEIYTDFIILISASVELHHGRRREGDK